MNFGEALAALKRGDRVARSGWNGKGMWIVLVHPQNADLSSNREWEEAGSDIGWQFRPRWLRALPWLGLKTADDGFVPWLASQTDILAEDWEIVL